MQQAIYYNETFLTQDERIEQRTEMTQEAFDMLMARTDLTTSDLALLQSIFEKHGTHNMELLKDVYAFYLSKP
jgi:hypothetical protein